MVSLQGILREGVGRGLGVLRRREREQEAWERRQEEGSGTGKATFYLSLSLVESSLDELLQPLIESQGLVVEPFHVPVTGLAPEKMEGDQNSWVILGHLDMWRRYFSTSD